LTEFDPRDPEMRAAFGELMAKAHKVSDDMDRRDAIGWVVVVLDLEPPVSVVSTYGPFEQPEQALAEAGKHSATSLRLNPDEEYGWSHVVVPLFKPAYGEK
jgi:hypothetical protein